MPAAGSSLLFYTPGPPIQTGWQRRWGKSLSETTHGDEIKEHLEIKTVNIMMEEEIKEEKK